MQGNFSLLFPIPFNYTLQGRNYYKSGVLLKPGETPNTSFFTWGSKDKGKIMNAIKEMYIREENLYYRYIITLNNTVFAGKIKSQGNYNSIERNKNITIWQRLAKT